MLIMKIAVVSPKSAERGGAENFYAGLVDGLNRSGHNAVQIDILADESTFEGILEAYCNCFYLDLNEYDLVISTKAPTYMVQHRNHISYLLHTMRVFYDMFDLEFDGANKEREKQRHLIHELDKYGLDPDRIKKHCVIGNTVAKRLIDADPFWGEIKFDVVYPAPTDLPYKSPERGEFVFLPGRLHRWKRIDLIIHAMKYVRLNIKLFISGEGEEYNSLISLVERLGLISRIEFLGKISDEELTRMYSKSIVVPFVPVEEDFGYVTIEAFKSKKPVITCSDSGEPSLIVQDGVSGFIVEPDPHKIAEKINYFIEYPEEAKRMGENGWRSVEEITWENVIDRIMMDPSIPHIETKRIINNIFITDNQILDPPIGGGRVRIHELYKNFNVYKNNITYLGTFDWLGPLQREKKLAAHFTEILVPMTVPQIYIDKIFSKMCKGAVTLDVTTPFLMNLTPKYQRKLVELMRKADIIIVTHPWIYPYVKKAVNELSNDFFVIYDSQNFEYKIKKALLNNTLMGKVLVNKVREIEGKLARESDLIFACSDEDAKELSDFYKIDMHKILIIPNGASISDIGFPSIEDKARMKNKFELGEKTVAIFLASGGYKPNDDAAEYICRELAPILEDVVFVLVGSVCEIVAKKFGSKLTKNIKLMGVVSGQDKIGLLHASDLALNPVMEGSGTNIKVFDYLAAGLPLITTAIGARGINFTNGEDSIIAGLDEFPKLIKKLSEDPELRNRISIEARKLAERYDWSQIAQKAENAIANLR